MFLNEHPTYSWDGQFITPNIFQIAALRYSQSSNSPQILSELIFPAGDVIREALHLMSQQSRKMLTNLASDLSSHLLNFANLTSQHILTVGDFCYIPDHLVYKNINSLTRALGHVVKVKDRSLEIRFSNGHSVLRHCNDVISCRKITTQK